MLKANYIIVVFQFLILELALDGMRLAALNTPSMLSMPLSVIAGIVICVTFGYILPPGIIARGTAIFFGICAASFLPGYVAALYWPRATAAGVWASMGTGVVTSSFGLIFLHRSESASLGICKLLTGKPELISTFPWPYVDTMLYSLPLSILALIVVSYCTRPPSRKVLVTCFHYYKR